MAELTGKTVSELPAAGSLADRDLFPISSSGSSKRLAWSTIKNAIISAFFPLSIARGGTGAQSASAARVSLGVQTLIRLADFPDYGIAVDGQKINATIEGIFNAMTGYSKLIVPWIQAGNTDAFGTLAGQLPGSNYGWLEVEKSAAVAQLRYMVYNGTATYIASFSTVNNVGFSGWALISTTTV